MMLLWLARRFVATVALLIVAVEECGYICGEFNLMAC